MTARQTYWPNLAALLHAMARQQGAYTAEDRFLCPIAKVAMASWIAYPLEMLLLVRAQVTTGDIGAIATRLH